MNTSFRANGRPLLQQAGIITARLRSIGLALGAALLLAGCSALQLGYNQAHTVVYWWIDGYADLNDGQSTRLRQDIDRLLAWHRQQELPTYAQRLGQWRTLAAQNLTAEQVCREADALHTAATALMERGHEPLARLALTLTPAQLDHLQRHQRKSNEGFEKDFLRGSASARLERRLERTLDRYETLYGRLTDAQVALVRQSLQASPFDPARTLAQRRERQAELLALIGQLQAGQPRPLAAGEPVPRAAGQAVLGWLQRGLFPSPTGSDAPAWVRHGCEGFAQLHNSTSAQQRRHAQTVLQGYEDDLRALTTAH